MLRLRPYKKCDAKYITSWINDEYSFRQWSADRFDTYPLTADKLNAYYDEYGNNDSYFEMTAFNESGVVGHLIMRFPNENKDTLRFGFVIVDDSKRGMGYGKEMLSLALKYSFDILKVSRVTLGVFENNPPAYHCYKSVGFRETATEAYNIFNEKWKCIEMEISK